MKKLLWKEWLWGRWLFICMTFILIIATAQQFGLYLNALNYKTENGFSYFKDTIISYGSERTGYLYINVILIAFAVSIIIGIDTLNRQQETMCTMPYRRNENIISKWIIGLITIIIPNIINFIFLSLMYFLNYSKVFLYNRYSDIFNWMLLSLFVYIFIITFVMFIQCLFGNKILGMFASLFILFLWGSFSRMMETFLSIYKIKVKLFNELVMLPYYNTYLDYKDGARISILVLATIILLFLMIVLFKKMPMESIHNAFIFPKSSVLIRLFFSINISIMFILLWFDNMGSAKITTVLLILFAGGVYFLSGKLIQRIEGER